MNKSLDDIKRVIESGKPVAVVEKIAAHLPDDIDATYLIDEYKAKLEKDKRKQDQLTGVEIEGVMCSLTSRDQWGLGSILPLIQLGNDFNFHFENGNVLNVGPANVESFMAAWIAAREEFF